MLKKIFLILLILGILGFVDAAYLTVQHYEGASLACSVFSGCDRVTSSAYATWGGVPVALVGMLYYAAIAITAGLAVWKNEKYFFYAPIIGAFGFFASLWFVYLQVFVLGAFCSYCLVSALITFILFGMSLKALSKFGFDILLTRKR